MKAKSDVSVVLPSYNERENIIEAIDRISAAVGSRLKEIIIVDDNSPDETWKLDDHDVVIASRYVKGGKDPRPFFRVGLSVILNTYCILFLGWGVRDYTSGFAAVKKEVFDAVSFSRRGFGEYFIEFAYRAKKNKFKIVEVPCAYSIRSGGVSKSDGDIKTLLRLGKDYGVRVLKLRFGVQ